MKPRGSTRGVVSTVVLLLVATVSVAVQAADAPLAKSGTGTIHSAFKGDGTTTQIGQNRMYWTGAYWGFSFNNEGKGFLHQMAWHCPAITEMRGGRVPRHSGGERAVGSSRQLLGTIALPTLYRECHVPHTTPLHSV